MTSLVVVGDGPAGAAAASATQRRGHDAVLVGRGRLHPLGTLELLSGRAAAALVALGWYDAVTARATPCDAVVSRWVGDDYVERRSMLEPGGLGWIVDRAWFDPLVRSLASADGVRSCRAPTPTVGNNVLLATGKHTPGNWRRLGPDLVALTVAVGSGGAHELARRLVVEAVSDGWWSVLDDGESLAVTYTTFGRGLSGRSAVRRDWQRALAKAPSWLPRSTQDGEPRVRPIRTRLALGDGGLPRVGDAALAVDPLSGHGLTLALDGGLRWHREGYDQWLVEHADAHEADGRAAYDAAGLRC